MSGLACPKAQFFFQAGAASTSFSVHSPEAREQYRQCYAIHASDVLESALLASVLRLAESSTYEPMHIDCGSREKEAPQRTGRVLNVALNRPSLLRWLEEVTGCGPLEKLEGMLAQTHARPGEELTWHDDFPGSGRRLAFVLNLTTQPYEGGEFEVRRKTGEPIFSHRYTSLNSALIFAVDHDLEHRVLPLKSGGPRRVFAGWAFAAGKV